jgi:hypothetical protein
VPPALLGNFCNNIGTSLHNTAFLTSVLSWTTEGRGQSKPRVTRRPRDVVDGVILGLRGAQDGASSSRLLAARRPRGRSRRAHSQQRYRGSAMSGSVPAMALT